MADGHVAFSEKLLFPGLIPSSVKTETPQSPTKAIGAVKVKWERLHSIQRLFLSRSFKIYRENITLKWKCLSKTTQPCLLPSLKSRTYLVLSFLFSFSFDSVLSWFFFRTRLFASSACARSLRYPASHVRCYDAKHKHNSITRKKI